MTLASIRVTAQCTRDALELFSLALVCTRVTLWGFSFPFQFGWKETRVPLEFLQLRNRTVVCNRSDVAAHDAS